MEMNEPNDNGILNIVIIILKNSNIIICQNDDNESNIRIRRGR